MKKSIKKKLIPVLGLLLALFWSLMMPAKPVQANLLQTVQDGGLSQVGSQAYGTSGPPEDVRTMVVKVINVFLGFLGTIFVILVLYSGFQWMTSQGDPAKIDAARKRIVAGAIGLVIILMSWTITTYITDCTLKAATNSSDPWLCPGGGN